MDQIQVVTNRPNTGNYELFNVYYGAENRQKRIKWVSGGTGDGWVKVNQLYSALQDLFDELNQMDDGVPMSAQTPTEYTIGIIDTGDKDPWFIDRTTVEHLYGGALKTASWKRTTGSNTGIVKVPCNNTNIAESDIGQTITHADGDSGTLLDVKGTGAGSELWIRPADATAANNWDSTSGTITCNGHTATQTAAASTGESVWANIYTLGTIEPQTHIYVYQNNAYLKAYKSTTEDWWSDGHIDVLINVKECDLENDEGWVTVFARQYSKTYSHYVVALNTVTGGRNPIPLQTGKDLDNQTGYRKFTGSSFNGTFTAGNYIYSGTNWNSATKKGVITSISGNDVHYYLIGEPINDFSNGDTVKEYDGSNDTGSYCTAGTPSNAGPAALSNPPTVTHGGLANGGNFDVDENGTPENYSIVIDCNQNPLTDVYQWCKYITRRGETDTSNTDGIEGERYIGSDYRIFYTNITGSINDGDVVTGATSGATGTVVNHNTTDKIIILRNSRGTFTQGEQVQKNGSNYVTGTTMTPITPIAAAPFGTFAGGKFFCAPGIVLTDYVASDVNNFQLTDDNGTVRVAPTKVNVTVGNTRAGDKIAVFRLTGQGGDIQKDRYTCTNQTKGNTTLVVQEDITYDEPGKTTGGVVRIVDVSEYKEYRVRFGSWSAKTFKLAGHADHDNQTNLTAGSGTTTTRITGSNNQFVNNKIGDLVYNQTRNAISYIVGIDTTNYSYIDISPAISGQTQNDTYHINVLPIDTTTSDTVYVPFIDSYETTGTDGSPGSETVQVVYQTGQATIYVRVRARNAGQILPFEQDSTITSTGMSVNVIRTPDTIFGGT